MPEYNADWKVDDKKIFQIIKDDIRYIKDYLKAVTRIIA